MPTFLDKDKEIPFSLFWDMDGTQFNSEPVHEKRWYIVAKNLGVELTPDLFDRKHKFPIPDGKGGMRQIERPLRGAHEDVICFWIFDQMRKKGKTEIPPLSFMKRALHDEYVNHAHLIEPRDGIPELIELLHQEGYHQANVTGCHQQIAAINLATLDEEPRTCLKYVIAADHTTRHKPAPEPYLLAFRKTAKIFRREGHLYATPKKVTVHSSILEDSPSGVESGLRSGSKVVQFLNKGQIPYNCAEKGFDPARLRVARCAEEVYEHIRAFREVPTRRGRFARKSTPTLSRT